MVSLRYVAQVSAALTSANEAILRALSEEQLFQRVCDAIVSDGCVIGAIAFLAETDNRLRPVAGAGDKIDATRALTHSVDLRPDQHPELIATAFRSRRAAIIYDSPTDTQFAKWHDGALIGIRSAAVVPIVKNKRSIGTLLCCSDQPDAFSKEQVPLLERMAENISFALDNFKREKQHKSAERAAVKLARMFAALSATNEAMMRAATRAELCQRVCEAAVLGGNFTSAAIAFARPDGEVLEVMSTAGPAADLVRDLRLPLDDLHPEKFGVGGIAFKSKRPCVTNDYLADTRLTYWYDQIRRTGTKSGAGWPLLKGDVPVGALLFLSSELGAFTPELIELMQRLADNVSFALANFDRIDEKIEADKKVNYLATHDGLTGLANRAMFSQLLAASIETSGRHNRQFALLFIDLDRFKIINDTLGHSCGDTLLIEMAQRLSQNVRSSDVVARLGGDEFVVILQEIDEVQEVMIVARKLLSSIMKPLLLSGQECRVTGSIGVAMYPANGDDEETLTKNADMAMYLAKNEGKNDVRFFSPNLKTPLLERLMLETSLRHALERSEFVLHYQPKRDLATGRVTGVEALLRWQHSDLGLLQPKQFMPLTEETGLVVEIGHWVLKTACQQNMIWQRAGLTPVSMSVNLSPKEFMHAGLLEHIDRALAESGMPAKLLQLEITESMVMQAVDRAIEVLLAIKSRGVRLAIDDFGTGYSSMAAIKQFPVDTLKIDRSFIRDLPQSAGDKAIADAIISLGKALGLTIVAEGVETADQEAFLREHACHEMQGFRLGKAVSAEEVPLLLQYVESPPLQPSRPAKHTASVE